jgi:hypothetical protein
MWIYNGEDWTEDEDSERSKTVVRSETPRPRYDEMMPELQVVEVVIPVPRNRNVPPLAMP